MTPYAWSTTQVIRATGGSLLSGSMDRAFGGIGINSRNIDENLLFVAIVGDIHDGHRYVTDVLDRGVKGVVVNGKQVADIPLSRMKVEGIACVAVKDTTRSLGNLARFNRNRGDLKVLAITGSNGKTSTRTLMEKVLSQSFVTLSTSGNLNNHIGLPLTLLRLSSSHQVAVLEMGMNHTGEIDHLGRISEPDVGVITNVGSVHLEGLGSIENVARAKGELLHTLRFGGTAILNIDDPRVKRLAEATDMSVLFFGMDPQADIRAEDVRLIDGKTAFTLITPSGCIDISLSTPARVMVSNALAAAAAGEVLGVSLNKIKKGLEAFSPAVGRMGIRLLNRDLCLVDDTYNANPSSMAAAIKTLARMRESRRTIAVLGDMLELGPQSKDLHRKVGRVAGEAQIDWLLVVGDFAADVADGAIAGKMPADQIIAGTKDEIVEALNHRLEPGDLILVKGSRGMKMETVVESICRWAKGESFS